MLLSKCEVRDNKKFIKEEEGLLSILGIKTLLIKMHLVGPPLF